MTILLALVAILLVVAGLVGTIHPVLPGPPAVFLGLWIGAWIGNYERVGTTTVWILLAIALLAQLLDFLASALGAKRVGASRQAVWGAVLGAALGIFFGFVGILLGPFIGAIIGELYARGGVRRAARVGIATWVGLLVGAIAKIALALFMVALYCLTWLF